MGSVLLMAIIMSACRSTGNGTGGGPRNVPAEVSMPRYRADISRAEGGKTHNDEVTMRDPFSQFRSAASKYFTPVAAHFALNTASEKTINSEIYIEFRGAAARLGVAYELESSPWVYVAVKTATGMERQFGLHTIVEYAEGSRRAFDELAKVNDLDAQVRLLADLTRKHAGILLKERTANLSELYLLEHKALRERERAEGFPTLDRPMLAELLGACSPDQTAVCAYTAVVEYSYSADDVAAFLKLSKGDVQRMITEFNTIR